MTNKEIAEYQDRIFDFLDNIPHNSEKYVVDNLCKAENKKLFIDTVIGYMRMYRNEFMGYLTFTHDMSKFYKSAKVF